MESNSNPPPADFQTFFTIAVGQPFDRWAELEATYHFVSTCKPGLFDATFETAAQAMAADDGVKPLAAQEIGTGKPGPGRGNKTGDNINRLSHGGTSAEYLVRRLKRDAPEIAKALARGEYPSARAAGIAAGIVKVPTPLEQVRKLLPKLTAAERRQLLRELSQGK